MLRIETSIREAAQMAEVLRDINFSKLYDLQEEKVASNVWVFGTPDIDTEDLVDDITTTLIQSGLSEFEVTFEEDIV